MATREPNYECPSCGHRMWAEFRGTIEVAVIVGCAGCGTAMHRLDVLGDIERAMLPVENLRDEIEAMR